MANKSFYRQYNKHSQWATHQKAFGHLFLDRKVINAGIVPIVKALHFVFAVSTLYMISKTISLIGQKKCSLYLYFINIETTRTFNSYRNYSSFVERKGSLLFSLWPREESPRTRLSTNVLLWWLCYFMIYLDQKRKFKSFYCWDVVKASNKYCVSYIMKSLFT